MTDKELRKLSRLELLEMLLEVSKENESLKKKLAETESEIKVADNIENLSLATSRINTALEHVNNITVALNSRAEENASEIKTMRGKAIKPRSPEENRESVSDVELYGHIMAFLAANVSVLEMMPEDIQIRVRKRIEMILEKKRKQSNPNIRSVNPDGETKA